MLATTFPFLWWETCVSKISQMRRQTACRSRMVNIFFGRRKKANTTSAAWKGNDKSTTEQPSLDEGKMFQKKEKLQACQVASNQYTLIAYISKFYRRTGREHLKTRYWNDVRWTGSVNERCCRKWRKAPLSALRDKIPLTALGGAKLQS